MTSRLALARRSGGALLALTLAGSGLLLVTRSADAANSPTVPLATSANYAVLGGSTVTNTNASVLNGSLGLSPGSSITGFPPGIVVPPGTTDMTNAAAAQAQADLTAGYLNAEGRSLDATTTADLGNLTLQAGVYAGPGKGALGLTGPLTLDGAEIELGFIFQTNSTLTTASSSSVLLINGAQACNVFWQVGSSATLGSSTAFAGNILALTSITVNNSVTVRGRALAQNGAVTLDNDVFVRPSCDHAGHDHPDHDRADGRPPGRGHGHRTGCGHDALRARRRDAHCPIDEPPRPQQRRTGRPGGRRPSSDGRRAATAREHPRAGRTRAGLNAVASLRPSARATARASMLVLAAAVLAGSATPHARPAASLEPGTPALAAPALPANPPPRVPAKLTPGGHGLREGPVAVPLEVRLPTLGTRAEILSVGILPNDVMDVPMGPASDPVWQQAFWYRGSALPGAPSTAVIAGHISDPLGRPGVFAFIDRLHPGDPIVVRDTRTGLDVRFAVTHAGSYSLEQAADPTVLRRMYGAGPVAGLRAQPSSDGLAHVTLITCAGTFRGGTHDHRLVVTATRIA